MPFTTQLLSRSETLANSCVYYRTQCPQNPLKVPLDLESQVHNHFGPRYQTLRDQAGTNLWALSLSALWFCQASHIPGLTEDVTGRPRYPPSSPRDDRVIQVTHIPPGDTKLALSSYGNFILALGLGTPAPCNSFPPGGPRGSPQVCMGEGCFAVCHRQWFENYSKKKLLQREEREKHRKKPTGIQN